MSQLFRSHHRVWRVSIVLVCVFAVLAGAFFLTQYVEQHESAQHFIGSLGYIGAYLIALIGGLSVILPVPPAGFAPLFTAAGLTLPLLIATFVLGTTSADVIGYYFGNYTKQFAAEKYPHTFEKIRSLQKHNHVYLWLGIFAYVAFLPLPNEAVVIPLAVIGIPLRALIIPLVLGSTVHHTLIALGVGSLFELL